MKEKIFLREKKPFKKSPPHTVYAEVCFVNAAIMPIFATIIVFRAGPANEDYLDTFSTTVARLWNFIRLRIFAVGSKNRMQFRSSASV